MNNLVELQDGEVTTTSLQVADASGKQHRNILKKIDSIVEDLGSAQIVADPHMFRETTYINEQNGQEYRMFIINRDGWVLLVGSFEGSKYTMFRYKYMKQFNAMETYIKEQQQHSFFIPETVDQQLTREKLAISKRRSMNDRSREVRAWVKLSEDPEDIVKKAAPMVLSQLLDISEMELLGAKQEI